MNMLTLTHYERLWSTSTPSTTWALPLATALAVDRFQATSITSPTSSVSSPPVRPRVLDRFVAFALLRSCGKVVFVASFESRASTLLSHLRFLLGVSFALQATLGRALPRLLWGLPPFLSVTSAQLRPLMLIPKILLPLMRSSRGSTGGSTPLLPLLTTTVKGEVRDRCDADIAAARSTLRRLRGLRHLTIEHVEEARASVQSVMTAVEVCIPGQTDRPAPRNSSSSPHDGRNIRELRPTSGIFENLGGQVSRATYQQRQREYAYERGRFPVWNSSPVDPQRGDGVEDLDGEIRRLDSHGRWLLYHERKYGRTPFYCD
jgi:hypothetical protein